MYELGENVFIKCVTSGTKIPSSDSGGGRRLYQTFTTHLPLIRTPCKPSSHRSRFNLFPPGSLGVFVESGTLSDSQISSLKEPWENLLRLFFFIFKVFRVLFSHSYVDRPRQVE